MRKASPPRSGVSSPHSYDCVILQHSEAATKSFHCWQSVMIRASIYIIPLYYFCLLRLVLILLFCVRCGGERGAAQQSCARRCRQAGDRRNPGLVYSGERNRRNLSCIHRHPTFLRLAPKLRKEYQNQSSCNPTTFP